MIRMVGLEIKIKSFPIETKQTIGKVFLLRRSVSNKMETGYQKKLFQKLKFTLFSPNLRPIVDMPAMTKSMLIEKILEYGETPPLH